uniref:Peptidase C1A papain C-terminal domain-containing protein n=1 Tax=Favella ehrenbergii TaxID=182087 RepID=A0A7S3I4I9_9SPIT|mmetsp:Transcript_32188/g.39905  ORF Transcript_32188/g.39905 Transcript_32188/m.39905 type:complete len:372 (+) Transcript_32188:106-1221(+)
MGQYYAVIGFFIATMAAAALYTFLNPQQSFAGMPVIDESAMLIHNGQSHRFQQGANEFFNGWTISDAKKLFETGLSDVPQIDPCKSSKDEEMVIPESFDWREENPECVQEAPAVAQNCTASYIMSTLSAASDRICKGGKKEPIQLSSQELIDCNSNTDCLRGTVNKVLAWGKRRGFLPESCYPTTGTQGECPVDHLEENECRSSNNFYRVVDFCIATETSNIKKEILTNGPVLAQLSPYTDMLTYSDGVYSRTPDAFRFQGSHVFKVVGWETSDETGDNWIVENTWGADWGENGYGKIAGGGETQIDFYALSFSMYPKTIADYYQEQAQAQMNAQMAEQAAAEDDLEADIDQIFLDDEDATVTEEGIDGEL